MAQYDIREAVDIFAPRQAVRSLAGVLGFSSDAGLELAIVVSELASNILKYGVEGTVSIDALFGQRHGAGILIIARDVGAPFYDLQMALQDGCDDRGRLDPGVLLSRGGIGSGLGAICRFTDSFQLVATEDGKGKAIHVERFIKRPRRSV